MKQYDRWMAGAALVGSLDDDVAIELVSVPNRTLRLDVRVEGVQPELRFQAPAGSAVSAGSLVAHIVDWLDLPAGTWSLNVDQTELLPRQILEEFEPNGRLEVVIKR
jgi:hypothetical protein